MKTLYYAIVNGNGNLITTDCKLPIYWNKEIAIMEKQKFLPDSGEIITLRIDDIKILLNRK